MKGFLAITLISIAGCSSNESSNQKSTDESDALYTQIEIDPAFDYFDYGLEDSSVQQSFELFEARRFDEALVVLEELLERDQKNSHGIFMYGNCLCELGQCDEALNYYAIVHEMIGEETQLEYHIGLAHDRLDQDDKAIDHYSKSIQLDPFNFNSRYNRALVYERKRDFSSAIDDYTNYIRFQPQDARAFNNRGRCHMLLDNYIQASSDFFSALQIEPNRVLTLNNLSIMHLRQEHLDSACYYAKMVVGFGGTPMWKEHNQECD